MFGSILCPIDFSADSRAALRYAAAVARRSNGSLTALYANDPWLANAAAAVYGRGAGLAERSREELERFAAGVVGPRQVACRVVLGEPARAILSTAAAMRADLIVLGTHGLGSVGKFFFGSTTARVLERTRIPVLAVPATHGRRSRLGPPRGWPGRQIIVPLALDRTTSGDAGRAAEVAGFLGASVVLVHAVVQTPVPPFMGAGVLRGQREAVALAGRRLGRVAIGLRRGGLTVRSLVAVGDPAEVVAALAARHRNSLVVLTLERRGRLFGSRPGTISYRVLQRGAVPVVALPRRGRRR